MKIRIEGWSDIGRVREKNQDRIFFDQKGQLALAVVADGMGGHEDGEFASAVVCELVREWWETISQQCAERKFQVKIAELQNVLQKANQRIKNGTAEDSLCGSTAIILFIHGRSYVLVSVGDSRCYRLQWEISGVQMCQLSVDDVWEQQEEIQKRYSPEEIKRHPNYGKLIRAVGAERTLECRVKTGIIARNTVFVLCSDGIYQYCENSILKSTLENILHREDIKESLESVRIRVYQNGAPDNLSVIAVHIF